MQPKLFSFSSMQTVVQQRRAKLKFLQFFHKLCVLLWFNFEWFSVSKTQMTAENYNREKNPLFVAEFWFKKNFFLVEIHSLVRDDEKLHCIKTQKSRNNLCNFMYFNVLLHCSVALSSFMSCCCMQNCKKNLFKLFVNFLHRHPRCHLKNFDVFLSSQSSSSKETCRMSEWEHRVVAEDSRELKTIDDKL